MKHNIMVIKSYGKDVYWKLRVEVDGVVAYESNYDYKRQALEFCRLYAQGKDNVTVSVIK